tara:strand:+ start:1413 stop:2153 length:741 start_codon:yes stop_codon:yes gene_type:complete
VNKFMDNNTNKTHEKIEEIKKLESKPKVLKSVFSQTEINEFLDLYKKLPTTVHNKKQNVIKKRWLKNFNKNLENKFTERLTSQIGKFKLDNLKTETGEDNLGLFQESYNPIGLHVDAGFNSKEIIYKQTLIPLTSVGSTVIFKNKFYGNSTNFTLDESELGKTKLGYGQNIRSKEHLSMYDKKPFSETDFKKYLKHERIDNLAGLEIELVYEWEIGSMLIFDRTNLHCSSDKIEGKKIGLTTFTKK